jgi:hypothetical protein
MKKSEKIILTFISISIIIAGALISWRVYSFGSQEEVINLSQYYESLYLKCSEKYAENNFLEGCCFLSVDVMTYDNYKLADENKACLDGYEPQSINCESSYTWCAKTPEIKK